MRAVTHRSSTPFVFPYFLACVMGYPTEIAEEESFVLNKKNQNNGQRLKICFTKVSFLAVSVKVFIKPSSECRHFNVKNVVPTLSVVIKCKVYFPVSKSTKLIYSAS